MILGEGELREPLEQQIESTGPREARAAAGLPRRRASADAKAFDLFVMSSVTEGLGTSLLDAMALLAPWSAPVRAASRKSSSTARPACWCRRGRTGGARDAIVWLLKDPARRGWASRPGRVRELRVERMVDGTLAASPNAGRAHVTEASRESDRADVARRRTRRRRRVSAAVWPDLQDLALHPGTASVSAHAGPARALQRALRVPLLRAEAARAHHPDVAEREVVAHRVVGVDRRSDAVMSAAIRQPGAGSASGPGIGPRG